MITFEIIRWKNLLSTGNVWTEIRLDKDTMTLVIGKNGAGKSTIIDAICYVLFGKPFRKINLELLINSINKTECSVQIEFKKGSKKYKVVRGMRPQRFEIYENGVLINQDAAGRDYQKYLEKTILGFNLKSFTQVVIVGSNSYTPFMKLGPQDRRAIIENLLDIEVFSTMNTIVKKRLKETNELINKTKESIQLVTEKIAFQEKYINDSKKNQQEQLKQKQEEYNSLIKNIEVMTLNSEVIQKDINDLLQGVANEAKIRASAKKLEGFRIKIESKIDSLTNENKFFEKHNECPKCHQQLANKSEVCEHNTQELSRLKQGLNELTTQQEKVEEQITILKELQAKINKRQFELKELTTRVSENQKQADKLAVVITNWGKSTTAIADLLKTKESLEEELQKQNVERNKAIEDKSYLDAAIVLLRDEGIKSKIIKQYLPVINKLVNKYLSELDFFTDFHLDEEFNETIRSRHRDKFVYDSFSEGQKRRIDLSLLFTWRAVAKLKNSVNTNLLILDEILDGSLDDDGMEEFMKLLGVFGTGTNTFLISHRGDMLVDKFNSVLKFKMSGLFSEVSVT